MGQGLARIAEHGDPQKPTEEELLLRQKAEDGTLFTEDPAAAPHAGSTFGTASTWRPAGIHGVDVSSHQGTVDWNAAWNSGSRYAYVKATEGGYYKNHLFGPQYSGAAARGMIRGAYHFAIPNYSSGAAQARFFVANGGSWKNDGKTLPPLLDIEYNPNGGANSCYNMSPAQLVNWMREFSNTMKALTGRIPMIYTTTDWWDYCTAGSTAFADHPLHIARYGSTTAGQLPAGWSDYKLWQYTDEGPGLMDWNQWRGTSAELVAFARNSTVDDGTAALAPTFAAAASGASLGAAVGPITCGLYGGGCYQAFSGGNVYYTAATGAHAVTGSYFTAWGEAGWQAKIGYPTAGVKCGLYNGGCYQTFSAGTIYSTAATGTHAVRASYMNAWRDAGWQMKIGYPTAGVKCGLYNGGCYQTFSAGTIYSTAATGTHAVSGPYMNAWRDAGWQAKIGYPTAPVRCGLAGDACYQTFSAGTIYRTAATGTHAVRSTSMNAWRDAGWQAGIGYPTAPVRCGAPGEPCYQTFTGATIYSTPTTGTHAVRSTYMNAWRDAGWQHGIGYPTGALRCGAAGAPCYQTFAAGTIYSTAATGTHAVRSTYMNAWRDAGWQNGIGYPTAPVKCGLTSNACYQTFATGTIYSAPTTGTHAVRSTYMNAWREAGWQAKIGYPTAGVKCGLYGDGCYQSFTGGNIYAAPGTGAHAVTEPFREAWRLAGWQMKLGYPLQSAAAAKGYRKVEFQRGWITWTTTGTKTTYKTR